MDNSLIETIVSKYQFSEKQIKSSFKIVERKQYGSIYSEIS